MNKVSREIVPFTEGGLLMFLFVSLWQLFENEHVGYTDRLSPVRCDVVFYMM